MIDFAANYIQDERVARDFLVRFQLDDVTGLDGAPVGYLETFVPL